MRRDKFRRMVINTWIERRQPLVMDVMPFMPSPEI